MDLKCFFWTKTKKYNVKLFCKNKKILKKTLTPYICFGMIVLS